MIAPAKVTVTATNAPLQNGDRLTTEEFCRRWDLTPNLKHAELIGGRVFMNPPISAGSHGVPHGGAIYWLGSYAAAIPGVQFIAESSVRFASGEIPQPDALLRIPEEFGGSSHFELDELYGAPELIVEIAASSAAYDLHDKKQTYLQHAVQEYLVWVVLEQKFIWFERKSADYVRLPAGRSGVLKSRVFPGLWLDTRAMVAHNQAKVLATLKKGLDSPEHVEFVSKLKSQARKKKKK